MNTRSGFVALALLLSACDDEQPAQQVPARAPAAPVAVVVVARAPEPAPAPVAPSAVSRKIEAKSPPSLPPASVELRLPTRLIDELTATDGSAPLPPPKPLLSPLFVEKPKPPSRFQLNGRLLTDDQPKEGYLESMQGVEIQLQYKH